MFVKAGCTYLVPLSKGKEEKPKIELFIRFEISFFFFFLEREIYLALQLKVRKALVIAALP